ncbi:MAG TPA: FCSD flavin-binding domain-containing protein [Xanthobacteraceae bacterium]|nr:FCSD flavin-binding domain-containing protein [Xanthobacteraceae bacterium]
MFAPALAQNAPRVVIIGGGFAGATCAREIKRAETHIAVTLVEANPTYIACPMSNSVIAGLRNFTEQQFTYDRIAADGVKVEIASAAGIDPQARTVSLSNGTRLPYDRLVLAPGIDFRWGALAGYDRAAAEKMPHAWTSGDQVDLLRRQLDAMEDGGVVAIAAPVNPSRCPPGAYERASLIAHYLKTRKPRSKLLVLDSKDTFSMQHLFQEAWKKLYPGVLEWVPLSSGGNVTAVDVATNSLVTDFDTYKVAVANVIPPQKAGRAAELAGVADRTGWCPVDPASFESKLQPNIHVIGDAAIAGAMPKSAFAANTEAKLCAGAVLKLLRNETPPAPVLVSTCYSLIAPDYAISIAGVYRPTEGQYMETEGSGGVSPSDAPASFRAQEASYADAWFRTVTHEIFG